VIQTHRPRYQQEIRDQSILLIPRRTFIQSVEQLTRWCVSPSTPSSWRTTRRGWRSRGQERPRGVPGPRGGRGPAAGGPTPSGGTWTHDAWHLNPTRRVSRGPGGATGVFVTATQSVLAFCSLFRTRMMTEGFGVSVWLWWHVIGRVFPGVGWVSTSTIRFSSTALWQRSPPANTQSIPYQCTETAALLHADPQRESQQTSAARTQDMNLRGDHHNINICFYGCDSANSGVTEAKDEYHHLPDPIPNAKASVPPTPVEGTISKSSRGPQCCGVVGQAKGSALAGEPYSRPRQGTTLLHCTVGAPRWTASTEAVLGEPRHVAHRGLPGTEDPYVWRAYYVTQRMHMISRSRTPCTLWQLTRSPVQP